MSLHCCPQMYEHSDLQSGQDGPVEFVGIGPHAPASLAASIDASAGVDGSLPHAPSTTTSKDRNAIFEPMLRILTLTACAASSSTSPSSSASI